jgi:hypothetical protein
MSGCLETYENPILYVKSQYTTIFVTKSLTIQKIIFDGTDLHPGNVGLACFNKRQLCGWNTASFVVNKANYPTVTVIGTGTAERKFGFITFQFIKDATNPPIPSLTISNCIIRKFIYGKYYLSFIQFDTFGGQVTITNTTFNSFFFPLGLITNTENL